MVQILCDKLEVKGALLISAVTDKAGAMAPTP